jgi:hypothetical protein
MAKSSYKSIHCKSQLAGQALRWRVGPKGDGFGAVSVGATRGPSDFLPFEITSDVINGPVFASMEDAEAYVRSR